MHNGRTNQRHRDARMTNVYDLENATTQQKLNELIPLELMAQMDQFHKGYDLILILNLTF